MSDIEKIAHVTELMQAMHDPIALAKALNAILKCAKSSDVLNHPEKGAVKQILGLLDPGKIIDKLEDLGEKKSHFDDISSKAPHTDEKLQDVIDAFKEFYQEASDQAFHKLQSALETLKNNADNLPGILSSMISAKNLQREVNDHNHIDDSSPTPRSP